jgi:hypothetical protein
LRVIDVSSELFQKAPLTAGTPLSSEREREREREREKLTKLVDAIEELSMDRTLSL